MGTITNALREEVKKEDVSSSDSMTRVFARKLCAKDEIQESVVRCLSSTICHRVSTLEGDTGKDLPRYEENTDIDKEKNVEKEVEKFQDSVFKLQLASYEKRLALFEAVLQNLLGPVFDYCMGDLEPDANLFFLNVLMNRREMAMVFWDRSAQVPLPNVFVGPRPVVGAVMYYAYRVCGCCGFPCLYAAERATTCGHGSHCQPYTTANGKAGWYRAGGAGSNARKCRRV